MKSQSDISTALRQQMKRMSVTQDELSGSAGVSRRTLTHVLSGEHDFKVSTLLVLADRLGLELVLVPKALASAASASATTAPVVKTRVQAALDNVRGSK